MSREVTAWTWEHSKAPGIDRLVLLALATHADRHGSGILPTKGRLAELCNVNDADEIEYSLAALVAFGELSVRKIEEATLFTINMTMTRCACGAVIPDELPGWCDNGHWNGQDAP